MMQHVTSTRVVLVAVPPRSYWVVVFCHVCLGKECDIWETRDRRAEQ